MGKLFKGFIRLGLIWWFSKENLTGGFLLGKNFGEKMQKLSKHFLYSVFSEMNIYTKEISS